jgi:hypothetical protein
MVRFFPRVLGVLLLAAAFASAVIDGTRSIAAGAAMLTSFGDACARMFPGAYPLLRPTIERRLPPWAWNPVALDVLRLPTWLVFAVLGLILLRLGRKPRRPIGYSSRD